ncbi:MAG: beta-N-acetylhexosaminidase [Flavobacteriaceae bacterium]|nr:MAG: beta-N-acetylhexosaminidase [Flavobacteriaceae bacterium]
MTYFKHILCAFLGIALLSCSSKPVKVFVDEDIKIIPKPVRTVLKTGVFVFDNETIIANLDTNANEAIALLTSKLKVAAGINLRSANQSENAINCVVFKTDSSLFKEGYELNIEHETIVLKAKSKQGFLYGVQSLLQLLPVQIESLKFEKNIDWIVPNIFIEDHPRFKWRGLMLDVSRHFFKVDYIKEVIDGLSKHKMNVLHLHLVDSQGWRIEIKKYPKLTEVGAFRIEAENKQLHEINGKIKGYEQTQGGFYTQDDIKAIVAYATLKGIEVIPEIEMPAHVHSAVEAYPSLSCGMYSDDATSNSNWENPGMYCAGKEAVFTFLEDVLLEVMPLFPSEYVHIGGDEAGKDTWRKCSDCQKRLKTEQLKNEDELQSYFIKRMEKFLSSKGKKLIGWDEILEGGLAKDATVMSWRGVEGGWEAAKHGNDVVMTPGSHCYFDHYQGPKSEEPLAWGGFTTLSKVYEFDPIVEGMTSEEESHVLGGQANLWSEYIPTESHSQYMIYPRLAAMSEALWSPKDARDWDDFSQRLMPLLKRYEFMGINYAKSAFLVIPETSISEDNKELVISLKNEFSGTDIRYTVDGSAVVASSKKYTEPFIISQTTELKASVFESEKSVGKRMNQSFDYHYGIGKKIQYQTDYNSSYKGVGAYTLGNAVRGSTNFHDGQWQGWLDNDMVVVIDLEKETELTKVTIGAMENQIPGIYFPISFKVLLSMDGINFKEAGLLNNDFVKNETPVLKDFEVTLKPSKARYVKVIAEVYKKEKGKGGVFIFIDEILIN